MKRGLRLSQICETSNCRWGCDALAPRQVLAIQVTTTFLLQVDHMIFLCPKKKITNLLRVSSLFFVDLLSRVMLRACLHPESTIILCTLEELIGYQLCERLILALDISGTT